MKQRIEARRAQLQTEYDRGQTMLQQMDRERAALEQTLLRIAGALQVLGELAQDDAPEGVTDGGDN
mgnify:FL=1